MSNYLSKKIKIISFSLMMLIVLLHANLISIATGANLWIQQYFTLGIAKIAVPLFFLISGFLFFKNCKNPTFSFFADKIKSRSRSVFLPYLIWSMAGLCFVYMAQAIPFSESFFSRKLETDNILSGILMIPILTPDIVYQLWFLKDLFVIVLVSPVLYIILKKIPWVFILLLGCSYCSYYHHLCIQLSSLFFFSIGAYIAMYHPAIVEKNDPLTPKTIMVTIAWLISCVLITVFHTMPYLIYAQQLSIFIGIIAVWRLYDSIYQYIPKSFLSSSLFSFSFFIYLFHEPTLTVIKKVMLRIGGINNINIFAIYIIAPLLTIAISILIGTLLKRYTYSFYLILTGGRK